MSTVDEILGEDSVKESIDELCHDIKDFSQIDFIHLLWGKKDEFIKVKFYGELDTLIYSLEKAKLALLVDDERGER